MKHRKIRFEDDDTHDPDEVEKDTRLKFRPPGVGGAAQVSALQAKMLAMAGQKVPEILPQHGGLTPKLHQLAARDDRFVELSVVSWMCIFKVGLFSTLNIVYINNLFYFVISLPNITNS